MKNELSATQQSFISEFGNLYSSYGFKRLNGLIIGLLISSNEPLSLDEIAKFLNRSKGLISTAAQYLKSHAFIKSIDGIDKRKDYYTSDEEIFINVFHFNMMTVQKNLSLADKFLHQIDLKHDISTKRFIKNLKAMKSFYQEMNTFYENFDRIWSEKNKELK